MYEHLILLSKLWRNVINVWYFEFVFQPLSFLSRNHLHIYSLTSSSVSQLITCTSNAPTASYLTPQLVNYCNQSMSFNYNVNFVSAKKFDPNKISISLSVPCDVIVILMNSFICFQVNEIEERGWRYTVRERIRIAKSKQKEEKWSQSTAYKSSEMVEAVCGIHPLSAPR